MARGYNTSQYNTIRYNANGAEVNLADSTTLVEALANYDSISLGDFIFLDDLFTIQITNKALADTLYLDDWLTVKLIPANEWSD